MSVMTHEVFNQPESLVGYNLFETNPPLREALKFNAPQLDTAPLRRLGAEIGTAEMQTHARLANVHTPQLRSHDRSGRRIDQVEFHPSYHALMTAAVDAGLHGTPWAGNVAPTLGTGVSSLPPEGAFAPRGGPSALTPAPHVLRAAGFMLFTELEPSILCPISMTYAATPALRRNEAIYAEWGPRLTSRAYDPVLKPYTQKLGVTMGMGMTEKQGGSDVRANTTQAVLDGRQAGQQGQCELRSRVRAGQRLAGGRGRAWRAADPGDGHHDPAGLRPGHQRADAPGTGLGAAPLAPASGLRQAPGRARSDAQCAG